MAERFPGPANKYSEQYASMRIEGLVDLLSQSCLGFSISGFTRNDQRASADILECAKPGDFVLRDSGYFSLRVFDAMIQKQIDFISRLRQCTNLYDLDHNRIDLLDLLQGNNTLDQWILVGLTNRTKLRIVASKLPEHVASQRRRKARLDRDRRLNHSKRYMRLLDWNILVTTVPQQHLSSQEVTATYRLRWRIETMFRAYKSIFKIDHFPPKACGVFICSILYAKLIYISLFQCLFQFINVQATERLKRSISLEKLALLIRNLPQLHLKSVFESVQQEEFWINTIYHSLYESRDTRKNYWQSINELSLG